MSRLDRLVASVFALVRRLRRLERREQTAFQRWLQNTNNLIHLSVLLFVPLLIGAVTGISNALTELSFLLFPPLASGTFTLFADPEGRYASPWKFVAGLTIGALCGWAALAVSLQVYGVPDVLFSVHPESAALSIFLTGLVTWALGVEEPAAFSTALLVLVTDRAGPEAYVLSVAVFGSLVAIVFVVWREQFYEQRARYLYETVHGDDRVLVPMRGESAETTALFGARLAAAHDAGKVVLLDVVPESDGDDGGDARVDPTAAANADASDEGVPREAEAAIDQLERTAETIRTRVGVPCEVVVASGAPLPTTLDAARNANCDLVVTPYEEDRGFLSEYVRGIFDGPFDAVAFRAATSRTRWERILVPVARPGDTAHAMIDFAARLAGRTGDVSVCTCIGTEVERRPAENRLANLVETVTGPIETRVARADIADFLAANAEAYDLVVLGSSRDRSAASRFISPPTFERIRDIDSDVAIFDRGAP